MHKRRLLQPPRLLNRWQSFFLSVLVILLALGTLFMLDISLVESATTFADPYYLFKQHLLGLLIAFIFFSFGLIIKPSAWLKLGPLAYIFGLCLLLLVFIPGVGLDLNGARRWFALGSIRFQPVEFFKGALIMYLSGWLIKQKAIYQFLIVLALPTFLLLLQPDMGSFLVVLGISIILYYLAGGKLKLLFTMGLISVPILLILIIAAPYRLQRLTSFINPDSDPLGASFHIRQISLALGRGGLWGKGLGNSNQKYAYIPESTTDSIFAIIAEEVGFVGSVVICLLFVALFYSGYRMIQNSTVSDNERLLALGMLSWIMLQTTLNLAAVVGLVPLTGIPLPFFSYGRSSQVMTLFACAIIIRTGNSTEKI